MSEIGLIGDIGGTNVRFALVRDGLVSGEKIMKCADYDGLAPAVRAYLEHVKQSEKISRAAFAIAGPVTGDRFQMTNHLWSFSTKDVTQKLGLDELRLFNDFHALAMGIPRLGNNDYVQIGAGTEKPGCPKVVLGPGTGLGVASLCWDGKGYVAMPGEGGHVTMPAKNQREFDIFQWLREEKYSHISAERVCSGKGLLNIYRAIKGLDGRDDLPDLKPEEISEAAIKGENEAAVEAWELLTGFLGTVAGNLALTLGAHGGVYIAGGILPNTTHYTTNSGTPRDTFLFCHTHFRRQFEAKGRFESYLASIPTFLITHPFPAFLGLKSYLREE